MLRVLIALALAASVCGSAVELASLSDLRALIGTTKFLAVEFYAPWCGHCKSLAPHWKAAAEELAVAGVPVTLAMIDADANRDAGQEYGVQGFPTIKFFRDGVSSDYNGPRETEGIVTYFKRATGDHVTKSVTSSDWTKMTEEFPVSVLFITDESSHDGIVQSVGDSLWETVAFAHSSKQIELDTQFQCPAPPCTFMSRKNFENEDAVLTYKGDFNTESLIAFINTNKVRSYGRLTQEDRSIVQAFFETKRAYKTIICVNDGHSQHLSIAAAVPSALKAIGIDDVFVGIVGSEFAAALSHFGVEESELPVVVVHGNANADDKRKFKSSLAAFTAADIAQFVKEAIEGKALPWVKSEPVPSSNDAPVKILVGQTVADIVLDNTKDVLVEVYAPWCGHCKSLEPIFESVALAFANEPRVVVAKLDGTKNDFSLHPVQGFPTLLVFPAHSKTPRPVQGRDARSLINAIVSNSAFTDLIVDNDVLPKSGVVPQFLSEMFPMLEEGVLALQSNVLFGSFTAFHFIAGAVVIFFGFAVLMFVTSSPKPAGRPPVAAPAAPAAAAAAAPAAADAAAADAASSDSVAAADATTEASEPQAPSAESSAEGGLRQRKAAGGNAAVAEPATGKPPKAKTSKGKTAQA